MDNVSSKFSEQLLGNCCGCVPIRAGVLIYAVLLLIDSLLSLSSFVSDDIRILVGGYTYHTRVIVGLLGFVGVFICLLGILGANDNSATLLRMFYNFTVVRIVVVLCIVCIDFNLLWSCETWRPGVAGHYRVTKPEYRYSERGSHDFNEYNPLMDYVAHTGQCQETRLWYFVFGAFDLILSVYWSIFVTRWYVNVIETCPSYLISLNHAKSPEFYTGYANLALNQQDRVQQRAEEGVHRVEDRLRRGMDRVQDEMERGYHRYHG
jgi:hypothetical protein